ncbi:NACHT domain-containing protein [Leptolyngbya sp. GGD]|uniref:NACHT domain-containing protein n=1 Tax=Leptolyngbya sp. GGD TaxID=2997907 RepID=UPI00227D28EA|nr:NACHT domain-containing protein [Leptolyngbya sp. GGD]MCY6492035.1 NACHT domain-containing protein [Leptolyngbya sp. GGD]
MIWFLKSRQAQTLKDSSVVNSTLQQTQAGRDALSFQNVEQVTIVYNGLFGSRSIASGIDWEWAGRVIHEQQAEVRNRLKYVLRDRDPLSLQLSEQPERVNLPALESERRLTIAGEDSELLDPGQLMIEVFGRGDIAGKLLILGTPGAGKTTLLLSLAEQLLAGANTQACAEGYDNPKTVIPVIFELSTWKNDNQSIQDWLIEQLYDLYGGDRKLKRYEQWLEQRVLLPLLDGLDELGMERQQKCMAKLNDFTRQYPQVVVCCRSKEFEESGIRLGNLRGAVELEPLSDRQIQTYLQQVEREGLWQQIQETPEMQQMLEPNNGEAGLLRVPLFVSLAAAIYDRNQPFRAKGELLERYIDRQLSFDVRSSDRRKNLDKKNWAYEIVEQELNHTAAKQHLRWIARQLQQRNKIEILIEQIDFSWLESPWLSNRYRLLIQSINLIVSSLFFAILFAQNIGMIPALSIALTLALLFEVNNRLEGRLNRIRQNMDALLQERDTRIQKWKARISNIDSLMSDVSSVIRDEKELAQISVEVNQLEDRPSNIDEVMEKIDFARQRVDGILDKVGVSREEISELQQRINKLRQALIEERNTFELKVSSYPNQGMWISAQHTLKSAIVGYLVGLVLILLVLIFRLAVDQSLKGNSITSINIPILLLIGLPIALFWSIRPELGMTCIKHICLRLVLWQNNLAPWNIAQFLNYCTERRLLQRIGGRYRFIHRELLEHFAKQVKVER